MLSNKRADFELWIQVFELIERREHLTREGLHKIVAIRASMNLGLSDVHRSAFPSVVPAVRPLVKLEKISDPNWLAGFVSAEGCFYVLITKSTTKIRQRVQLIFKLTQHSRDENLMKSLIKYFECGYIEKDKSGNRNWIDFRVTKFNDIANKIIPFFQKHLIQGVKVLDFGDFCQVAYIMKNKQHLTEEGLEQIKKNQSRHEHGKKVNL